MPLVRAPSLAQILSCTQQLSPAQIRTLHTTPIEVVPAPGVGKLLVPFGAVFTLNFATVAYNVDGGSGENLTLEYSPTLDSTGLTAQGLLTQLNSAYLYGGTFPTNLAILPGDDNAALVIQGAKDYSAGPITTTTLGAGGLGYVIGDTGTITNGANNATYRVLTVGAGGAVLTFSITNPGTACTVANGNATVDGGAQPGVGVGFTVNITAVQTGDGTLKIVSYYQIIDVP